MSFATTTATTIDTCCHGAAEPRDLAELSPQERQRAFALRFRTEMCRTYVATGRCEYRDRCMFAHGNCEVRTEAMNERDGLVGDKAIRAWMRERRTAVQSRRGQRGAFQVNAAASSRFRTGATTRAIAVTPVAPVQPVAKQIDSPVESELLFAPCGSVSSQSRSSVSSSDEIYPAPAKSPAETAVSPASAKGYRYNPYSQYRVKVFA